MSKYNTEDKATGSQVFCICNALLFFYRSGANKPTLSSQLFYVLLG